MTTTYIIRSFGGVLPIVLNTTPVVPQPPNVTFYVRSGAANELVRSGTTSASVRSGSAAIIVRGA